MFHTRASHRQPQSKERLVIATNTLRAGLATLALGAHASTLHQIDTAPSVDHEVSRIAERMFDDPQARVQCRPDINSFDLNLQSDQGRVMQVSRALCAAIVRIVRSHDLETLSAAEQTTAARVFGLLSLKHTALTYPGATPAALRCFSVQRLEGEMKNLGFEESSASYIAEAQNELYDRLPTNEKTPACQPGGAFDLGISRHYLDGQLTH